MWLELQAVQKAAEARFERRILHAPNQILILVDSNEYTWLIWFKRRIILPNKIIQLSAQSLKAEVAVVAAPAVVYPLNLSQSKGFFAIMVTYCNMFALQYNPFFNDYLVN